MVQQMSHVVVGIAQVSDSWYNISKTGEDFDDEWMWQVKRGNKSVIIAKQLCVQQLQ